MTIHESPLRFPLRGKNSEIALSCRPPNHSLIRTSYICSLLSQTLSIKEGEARQPTLRESLREGLPIPGSEINYLSSILILIS